MSLLLNRDELFYSLPGILFLRNSLSAQSETGELGTIDITYGYSRAHRPDLKQFMVDLMCSGDGDIPLYLRVGSGNETDSSLFARLILEFRQQWDVDALFVADAALYTSVNLQQMAQLRWVSRVPATLSSAKELLQQIHPDALMNSSLTGYQIAQEWESLCRRATTMVSG